jgi:hypothetical protein
MSRISAIKNPPGIHELIFFSEAWFTNLYYTVIIKFFSFSSYAERLGRLSELSVPIDSTEQKGVVEQVAHAVRRAGFYCPWKAQCMVQAITGKQMLKRRGIAATLYFGVKQPGENMQAHAWLKIGNYFVTGEKNHAMFTVVAFYT